MEQIARINHIGLRGRYLETARSFYEKPGFEFIVGPVGPEPVAIMEHPSGIDLNLVFRYCMRQENRTIEALWRAKRKLITHLKKRWNPYKQYSFRYFGVI